MKGLNEVFISIVAIIVVMVYSNALSNALDLPDVHVSNSTQECVGVVNYAEGDDYSCQNLPTKYNHVWVK